MSRNPQTPDAPLTNIFINYRRDDTRASAGRLEADLERHFPGRVFRDIHDIEAGSDFVEAINDEVGKCGALLVMIGGQWLTLTDKSGKRRLDNPRDFVAAEIAGALLRKDVRVIPVLVDGAQMPTEEELPESLKDLVRRNATKLDDEYWDEDLKKLVAVLEKVCGASPQLPTTNSAPNRLLDTPPDRSGVTKIAIAAGASALAAALAVGIFLSTRKGSPQAQPQQFIAGLVPSPTATLVPSPTATPADATPRPLERRAVVDLARNEAEFFFPFDTTGDKWKWYLTKTKVDDEEYRWEVEVPNKYSIRVYLIKDKDVVANGPGDGDFDNLLSQTKKGIESKDSNGDWAGLDEKYVDEKYPFNIEREAEPGGLRVFVTGRGVGRMFANKPPKVFFLSLIATEKKPDLTTTVEYR